jgi:thiol-disulfide isomerase/thioredoxin
MQKKKLKLKAQHDHVFVMYWATWCANCKEKLTKTIPKLKKKYKNIKFIAVNIDQNQKRALHQIEKYQLYKVPHYRNKKLVKKLNVRNSPAWSFFSVKGNKLKLIEHNTGFKLNNIKRKFSSI